MGRFLYCLNDKPIEPKPNRIDVPSPLKDKPPIPAWMSLRYWECSGDLDMLLPNGK
jgi:hypothetical protein